MVGKGETEVVIAARDLHKTFGGKVILAGITLTVRRGEFIAIIGPSGCGKTTLLRCLMGLEKVDSGFIEVLGYQVAGSRDLKHAALGDDRSSGIEIRSIDSLRTRVGMVFQHLYLWPLKTVRENVMAAPRRVLGRSQEKALAECRLLLQKVGLSEKEAAFPEMLSGGQQQRVALARALAMDPEILLLDEITSALDPELVVDLLELIKELLSRRRTVMVVTHELRFAREVADRVVFMEAGRIVEEAGSEDFFTKPQTTRTRAFLEKVTWIRR